MKLAPFYPKGIVSSQPWALSRNPFGIHIWNLQRSGPGEFRKSQLYA